MRGKFDKKYYLEMIDKKYFFTAFSHFYMAFFQKNTQLD